MQICSIPAAEKNVLLRTRAFAFSHSQGLSRLGRASSKSGHVRHAAESATTRVVTTQVDPLNTQRPGLIRRARTKSVGSTHPASHRPLAPLQPAGFPPGEFARPIALDVG